MNSAAGPPSVRRQKSGGLSAAAALVVLDEPSQFPAGVCPFDGTAEAAAGTEPVGAPPKDFCLKRSFLPPAFIAIWAVGAWLVADWDGADAVLDFTLRSGFIFYFLVVMRPK